ncbi:MAG: ribbon-helix-helix protein, CopG family [Devosia nanyangense]|uniref:Ribbon-helix-helix protein, CopG family n=1 Tax=Devosia nanyangense TaxID=1228055 RepID=A0A933L4W0_9HYPH|nr:ribbon-helix-helix protein, CopG family [Devosia nanyangense]
MAGPTTTITVRLPIETKAKLDRLATITRRSRSFLAADAVAAHVDFELSILDAVDPDEDDHGVDRKQRPRTRSGAPAVKASKPKSR